MAGKQKPDWLRRLVWFSTASNEDEAQCPPPHQAEIKPLSSEHISVNKMEEGGGGGEGIFNQKNKRMRGYRYWLAAWGGQLIPVHKPWCAFYASSSIVAHLTLTPASLSLDRRHQSDNRLHACESLVNTGHMRTSPRYPRQQPVGDGAKMIDTPF